MASLNPFAQKESSKVLQVDVVLNKVIENLDHKNALELCGFDVTAKNLPTMAELMVEFPLLAQATIKQGR